MVSTRVCGLKCSICCSVISGWGIIMLTVMGACLTLQSASFVTDFIDEHGSDQGPDFKRDEFVKEVMAKYEQASYNCYASAVLYFLTLCFSLWQYRINLRMEDEHKDD